MCATSERRHECSTERTDDFRVLSCDVSFLPQTLRFPFTSPPELARHHRYCGAWDSCPRAQSASSHSQETSGLMKSEIDRRRPTLTPRERPTHLRAPEITPDGGLPMANFDWHPIVGRAAVKRWLNLAVVLSRGAVD